MAFHDLEPFAEDRADTLHGVLAATVANYSGHRGKSPARPREFIPQWGPPRAQTVDEMRERLEAIARAFGGDDTRGNRGHAR